MFKSDFINSESGAITVDWVVLTAAIVALGFAVNDSVAGGVEKLTRDVSNFLANIEITTEF